MLRRPLFWLVFVVSVVVWRFGMNSESEAVEVVEEVWWWWGGCAS